jgi:AcrR family transcriptional regulator
VPRTASFPPRSQRRPPLSRDRIVEAAIELVEHHGPEALSMRRLGAQLGVEGMALYHYLAGREELLHAIADRLLAPLRRLQPTDDWRDDCRRFASGLRGIAKARPSTFLLVGLQPLDTPGSLQPVERLLEALVAAGFAAHEALAVYRAVASYARGYALAEATGFTVDAANVAGRERLRTLDARAFPILGGRADQLARLDPDTAYELGLHALLDGLRDPTSA